MKRLQVVLFLAVMGLTGCDTEESRSVLEPEIPDPSLATIGLVELTPGGDCSNCLVQPTTLVREMRNPPKLVFNFEGTAGQQAELVLRASVARRSVVVVALNRKVLLRGLELMRSGESELRIPLELREENALWIWYVGPWGETLTFWVEGGEDPGQEEPLWTDVGVVPTGSPSAPVVVADNRGLAIVPLTDPSSGRPEGAASFWPGLERPGIVRFGPDGAPAGAFYEGGAAYLSNWALESGVPSVSVTIPGGGSLPQTSATVALPSPFAPVVQWILSASSTPSPGGIFGTSSLQRLSHGEALAAQAAWCALEQAGALSGAPGLCRTSLIDGVPAFWAQWTEEIGYGPFLDTVTGSLGLGGCSGEECLTMAVDLAASAVLEATPRNLVVLAGDAQVGAVGASLPDALQVLLTNEFDIPLAGFLVDFAVDSGEGSLGGMGADASASTDGYGTTEMAWALGPVVGTQSVRVGTLSFLDLEGGFTATAEEAATSALFRVTSGTVPVTANKASVCNSYFGSGFQLADWTRVVEAVANGVGKDEILPDGTAFVSNGGSTTTGGFMSAHYVMSAFDPGGTPIAIIAPDLLWLISSNSNQRVLCMGTSP